MSREERGGQHQQPRPQQQQPGGRKPRSYEAEEMLTGNFDIDDDPYGVIRVDDVEFGESVQDSFSNLCCLKVSIQAQFSVLSRRISYGQISTNNHYPQCHQCAL